MRAIDSTVPGGRAIAWWLLVCCALVFAMVVLGGVTRLTGSGLSMVEWDPVFGMLPPLSQGEWQDLFARYQQTPEYRHVNLGMDLEGFKGIFWLEYLHRVLGRLIGIVFLVPFLYFLLRRRIPARLTPRLAAMFVLGGLQGLLGWYMVKSGLIDNPHVSAYRLTAHLMLAVLVYGFMLWTALDLLTPQRDRHGGLAGLKAGSYGLLGLSTLTMASGGFVAGLKAGLTYNTFPLMGGQWVPDGLFAMEPWYLNFFENVTTVQFDHRMLAVLTFLAVVWFWLSARRHALPVAVRGAAHALLLAAVLQVALGISTLLLQVPVVLASLHQAGAMALFTVALVMARQIRGLAVRVPAAERMSMQAA